MRSRTIHLLCALGLAAIIAGCGGSHIDNVEAAPKTPNDETSLLGKLLNRTETIVVPQGTPVAIRLQSAISSASANSGDSFAFELVEPLVVSGKTIAPAGTEGVGRVVAARKSGRLHNSGYLRIALASIVLEGKQVPIHSSSVFIAGGSYKKRNWAWIGGGAGAGALIGGLAAGPKGALVGSAIGAGSGTTAAYATGKKEVSFAVERQLTFRLSQPLQVELKD